MNSSNKISIKSLSRVSLPMYVHFINSKSGFCYCVTQCPDPNNLQTYKDLLLKNNIKTLVKLCDGDIYDIAYLEHHGITVINIPIDDGTTPDKQVIKNWINIIKNEFDKNNRTIAVHCMSGLGRAPLFVCVGLILIDKIDPIIAITEVRNVIKGALNTNQINFLQTLKTKDSFINGCTIS